MKTLLALLLVSSPLSARADVKALEEFDMKQLSQQAARLLSHCADWKGPLTLSSADMKNKTDESLDKERFIKILLQAMKKSQAAAKAHGANMRGLTLKAELTSSKSQKDRIYTGKYSLKVTGFKGGKKVCEMKSEIKKSEQL